MGVSGGLIGVDGDIGGKAYSAASKGSILKGCFGGWVFGGEVGSESGGGLIQCWVGLELVSKAVDQIAGRGASGLGSDKGGECFPLQMRFFFLIITIIVISTLMSTLTRVVTCEGVHISAKLASEACSMSTPMSRR